MSPELNAIFRDVGKIAPMRPEEVNQYYGDMLGKLYELRGLSVEDAQRVGYTAASSSADIEETFSQAVSGYAQQMIESMQSVADDVLWQDPSLVGDVVAATSDAPLLEQYLQGALGAISARVDMSSGLDVSQAVIAERIASEYGDYAVSKVLTDSGRGYVRGAADFAALALWTPDYITDMMQLSDEVMNTKNYREMLRAFAEMPAEAKPLVLEQMLPHIEKSFDGNIWKQAAFVDMLMSPAQDLLLVVDEGFAAADATGVGLLLSRPLASLVTSVRNGRVGLRSIRAASTTNPQQAALDALRQAKDAPQQVADATSPFPPLPVVNGTGVSAHAQELELSARLAIRESTAAAMAEDAIIRTDAATPGQLRLAKENFRIWAENTAAQSSTIDNVMMTEVDGIYTARFMVPERSKVPQYYRDVLARARKGAPAPSPKYEVLEVPMRFTVNDVGTYDIELLVETTFKRKDLSNYMLSPEILLRGTGLVPTISASGLQTARLERALSKAHKDVWAGLSGSERQRVNDVLLRGDGIAEYDYRTLTVTGVDVNGTAVRLTDTEAHAYYKMRQLLDDLHYLNDGDVARHLRFTDHRVYRANVGGEEISLIAGPATSIPADARILRLGDNAGEVSAGKARLEMQNGWELRRVFDPQDGHTHILIPKAPTRAVHVSDVPKHGVLNKIPGYIPRIQKGGMWVVREGIDGAARAVTSYSSKYDAEQFIARNQGRNYSVQLDRNMTVDQQIATLAHDSGGLFTGPRSTQAITLDGDLYKGRLSPLESVDRYINYISNITPMVEYRAATIQRFKNTAKALAEREGAASAFRHAGDIQSQITLQNTASKAALEAMRAYLNNTLKLASKEETLLRNTLIWASQMIEGKGAPSAFRRKAARVAMDMASTDPVAMLRALAFDTLIGVFNLRHSVLQLANAAPAISMYPIKGMAAAKDAMLIRVLLNVNNESMRKVAARSFARGIVDDTSDLLASTQEFMRSGLYDSVMRTSEFQVRTAGISMGAVNSVREAGRMFYTFGVTNANMVAWGIARRNWKEANPGKVIDDVVIQDLAKETLRLTMNLQKENAALFQKDGVVGLATQFMPVLTKFLENTVTGLKGTGAWSRKEASAALAGQFILFGTGGTAIYNMVQDMLPHDAPEAAVKGAADGLVGLMFKYLGNADVATGSSFNILSMLDDNAVVNIARAMVTGEDIGLVETLSGASGGLISRTTDALTQTYVGLRAYLAQPAASNIVPLTAEIARSFARITSSFNNAERAWMLYNYERLYTSRGSQIVAPELFPDGVTIGEGLARAMGFQHDHEVLYWENRNQLRNNAKFRAKVTDQVAQTFLRYGDSPEMRSAHIQLLLAGFTDVEKHDIMERAIERFIGEYDGRTVLEGVVADHIRSDGRTRIPLRNYTLNAERGADDGATNP